MIIISMRFSCDFYLMTRKRYARAAMMIVAKAVKAAAACGSLDQSDSGYSCILHDYNDP